MKREIALSILLSMLAMEACADEAPEYDRPGIGFSTRTVGTGVLVWEQGLPDGSRDRRDGTTTIRWTADSLLRLGLGERLEVQIGADSWSHLHVRGAGGEQR